MQFMFLGSGSAFCLASDNFQSNMLLTSKTGKRLLIDCGTDIRFSLAAEGLTYRDVDDVYVSHLHADHVGGLEFMGFATRFDPQCEQPGLYISESITEDLWSRCLSGGMTVIEDNLCACSLSDYFSVNSVPAEGIFNWEGVEFKLIATDHITGRKKHMTSYGLYFSVGGQTIFLTTDTKFSPQRLGPYLEGADLIFHDCEIASEASGVHANFKDLLTLPEAIKKKMWLYHYDDGARPDPVQDGFCGFVKRGQVFDLPD